MVHVPGSTFERAAELVGQGRVGPPVADDGSMDGVGYLLRVADGRSITFGRIEAEGGGSDHGARDVDGQVYRLEPDAREQVAALPGPAIGSASEDDLCLGR